MCKIGFYHVADDEETFEIPVLGLFILTILCVGSYFFLFLVLDDVLRLGLLVRHLPREDGHQLANLRNVLIDPALLQIVQVLVDLQLAQHFDECVSALLN